MKPRSRIGALLSLACFLTLPVSADFNAGLEAYRREDFAAAIKEWKPLAERGDPRAQSNLGAMYARGDGVRRDYEEARKWLRLAAAQGNETAQGRLVGIANEHNSFSTWLLRLSLIQLVRFFVGIMFAGLVIVAAYFHAVRNLLPSGAGNQKWERVVGAVARFAVLAVILALYGWGGMTAYRVASNLGESPDAAIVKSVYSWFEVAGAFGGWMIDHRNDPLGQTVSQFRALM